MTYKEFPQNVLFGYSSASNWAFTQPMTADGKLGANEISAASWTGGWPTLTTFTTHDKHGNSLMYVLGSGNSSKTIFIQHVSALGALGAETFREDADKQYNSCCSYYIDGTTYIFLQSKSDKSWVIRPVSFDGKLDKAAFQGKFDTYYETLFSVFVANVTYLVGHSSDGNRFFIQAINQNGSLGAEKTNVTWGDYYKTLIPVKINENTFIFGQNESKKRWFTQQIVGGGTLADKEANSGTWAYYYGSATSYTGTENGVNTTYLFAQTSSDSNKWFTQIIDKDGVLSQSENTYGHFGNYYSFLSIMPQPQRDPKDAWMAAVFDSIKDKKLNQIIIPGSHDAGMYATTECTTFGTPSNTQTQGVSVYDQLSQGARYFDLRVAARYLDGGDVKYTTAHVSDVGKIIFNIGYQGCLGPSMDDILADVAKFAADPKHSAELIILKFSHFLNCCWPGFAAGWDTYRQQQFALYITGKIGQYMIRYSGAQRIGELSYAQLLELGKDNAAKVMVVIDNVDNKVRSPANGIFRYMNYVPGTTPENFTDKTADLCVFDDYSNTSDVETMIDNQHQLYLDPKNHGGDMYLLSWTLTQTSASSPSIDSMAHTANSRLPTSLHDWYAAGQITATQMPNILYVDYLSELEAEISHTILEMIYKK